MSNVVLAGLVKTAVAELVSEQKPFNLALVLSRIPQQTNVVIDMDFVETQMNKLFYNEEMADFEISIVDGDIVYAPMLMSNQQISDALSGKPQSKPAQRHIYNLVYSPDSRGRIRFPVRLTSAVQKDGTNKVWVVTKGDEIRVSSHKPRSAETKQYTIDCYGNILLKAPTDSVYEMRLGRYSTLVAKPVTI